MKKKTYIAIILSLSLMYGQAMVLPRIQRQALALLFKATITPFPVRIPLPLATTSAPLAGRMLLSDTKARQAIRKSHWNRTMRTVPRQLVPDLRQLTTEQRPLAITPLLPGQILSVWELQLRRRGIVPLRQGFYRRHQE